MNWCQNILGLDHRHSANGCSDRVREHLPDKKKQRLMIRDPRGDMTMAKQLLHATIVNHPRHQVSGTTIKCSMMTVRPEVRLQNIDSAILKQRQKAIRIPPILPKVQAFLHHTRCNPVCRPDFGKFIIAMKNWKSINEKRMVSATPWWNHFNLIHSTGKPLAYEILGEIGERSLHSTDRIITGLQTKIVRKRQMLQEVMGVVLYPVNTNE